MLDAQRRELAALQETRVLNLLASLVQNYKR
jgi:hypothetical protein